MAFIPPLFRSVQHSRAGGVGAEADTLRSGKNECHLKPRGRKYKDSTPFILLHFAAYLSEIIKEVDSN